MKRFSRAIVPGSFDPVTYGHLDLVANAKEIAAEVIVVILDSDIKALTQTFTPEERAAMLRRALQLDGNGDVEVVIYDGLLVDAFLTLGADGVVRGYRRDVERREDELQMALHSLILPGFKDKVYFHLQTDEKKRFTASSIAKSFVDKDVDVSTMVPIFVKRLLEERIRKQFRLGVTGPILSGKTFISKALARYFATELEIPTCRIGVDELLRELYDGTSRGEQKLREAIAGIAGEEVLLDEGRGVNRDAMKRIVFAPDFPHEKRLALHNLTEPHVSRRIRESLVGKEGLVLFEWATLAENGLGGFVNNNVLLVESADREALAEKRGVSSAEFEAISAHQWDANRQAAALEKSADKADTGTLIRFCNNPNTTQSPLPGLATTILEALPGLEAFEEKKGELL